VFLRPLWAQLNELALALAREGHEGAATAQTAPWLESRGRNKVEPEMARRQATMCQKCNAFLIAHGQVCRHAQNKKSPLVSQEALF
jgi:RNase P subunit RPR2